MINFLIRFFIKDHENVNNLDVRGRYGVLAGSMGIFLNLCLFAAKFLAGLITASISITADAFNNLSDAGSSVVTLVGFKMASRPADKEHPFGHGRVEYLSGLAISMAILIVGMELARSSIEKILHPAPVQFGLLSASILIVSVLVKLWMAYFNRTVGRKINSAAMLATFMDSLTDAVATTSVLFGMLISSLFNWQIDGYIGVLVALFILYSGFSTARDSLSPLLGQAPDEEFVNSIGETVLSHEEIVGIHDLIIHDYGPGRCIISLHAEIPSNRDILEMHDIIDQIEMELREKFQCDVTIHMDPIVVDDIEINDLRMRVVDMIKAIDTTLTIHDFRMVKGPTHTNLIFDILAPYHFRMTDAELIQVVRDGVKQLDNCYFAVIRIDKAYAK